MPQLPHGALGPSTGERITVLLWYVAVVEDGVNLEVLEAGTINDLTVAHHDMVAPPCTPSGHAN